MKHNVFNHNHTFSQVTYEQLASETLFVSVLGGASVKKKNQRQHGEFKPRNFGGAWSIG